VITKYQLDLMKHAIGAESKDPGYRNYFAATPDSEDDREWTSLVEKGYARVRRQPDDSIWPDRLYNVTPEGVDFVIKQMVSNKLLDKMFGKSK
jgi:hypothetical protein